jgi:hypothetical protein
LVGGREGKGLVGGVGGKEGVGWLGGLEGRGWLEGLEFLSSLFSEMKKNERKKRRSSMVFLC